MKKKLMAFLLVLSMVTSMAPPALAAEEVSHDEVTEEVSHDEILTFGSLEEYEKYLPDAAFDENSSETTEVTWNMAIAYLLRKAGMEETQLGEYPRDYIGMADSLGMISYDEHRTFDDGDEEIQVDEFEKLKNNEGLLALEEAMAAERKEPLFVNGMAQPIFPFTTGAVLKDYKNEDSDTIRFFVYVETDYDTDGDGKLDLVKALVQLPRAAAEGDFKAATIYEARPYISGCTDNSIKYDYNDLDFDPYTNKVGTNDLSYRDSAKDYITDWQTAEEFVNEADASEWYYMSPMEGIMDYEDLEWYDYYLVRGFAVVECAGIGTRGSEGFESCGSHIEIDAFKCVIEWLNGKEGRKAYTDKEAETEVEAYWANGKVGMTGRSYGGTTQFGLATTGVEGLETIVPVAGISSWYEYTNSQGISTRKNVAYTNSLAAMCAGRYLDSEYAKKYYDEKGYDEEYGEYQNTTDYDDNISETYPKFLGNLQQQQLKLNGDYASEDPALDSDTWKIRDYTLNADNINCSALIVHGLNDYNVRPKMFEQMYDAFKENNNEVKLLLHQDGHLTPTYDSRKYVFDIGEDSYDEILNRWFSYYLYDVDNDADDMPEVIAQDAHKVGKWNTYSSYKTAKSLNFEAGEDAEEETTTISSDYSLVGGTDNWKDKLTEDSTSVSAMYTMPVDKKFTIKGASEVKFSALTTNEEPKVVQEELTETLEDIADLEEEPRGKKTKVVDHDLIAAELGDEESVSTFAAADVPIEERDALMVSAMLVDIAPEGETFDVFQTYGSYVPTETLEENGAWMGGGLENMDLKIHKTKEVDYNIITRGWMDLANPDAGWDSSSVSTKKTLGTEEYDYTIYLQPTVYEVAEGHTLALVLYTYEPGMASYNQNYCITINNASVEADIPVDGKVKKTKKYDVIVKDTENGKVEVNDNRANFGQEITITVDPEKNYELKELEITDQNGNKVDYEEGKKENTFVFDMPKADVTIEASFSKAASIQEEEQEQKEEQKQEQKQEPVILTIGSKTASVFGEYVENDVAPEIVNGRTMLPIRFVVEALGGTIAWDEPAQKVTITMGETVIEIFISQPFATVNGNPVQLDSSAYIAYDRTYLPLRFVAENLSAQVIWDNNAQTVTILPAKDSTQVVSE